MRWSRSLPALVVLMLLLAAPAYGVGSLTMRCPRCDHVDVEGHGLQANASLVLVIRDVRSGQEVVPETTITTNGSGSFSGEYDVDLTRHPLLLASVYDQAGSDVELAAHTRASAPPHCKRAASLPYTGWPAAGSAALAAGLLGGGALLLLLGRRRPPGPAPSLGQSRSRPRRWAIAAASTRLATPSLARMLDTPQQLREQPPLPGTWCGAIGGLVGAPGGVGDQAAQVAAGRARDRFELGRVEVAGQAAQCLGDRRERQAVPAQRPVALVGPPVTP